MARPIEQVEQDLTQLRSASCQLGAELTANYKSYFDTLSPALKKQSIQGCYYLSTTCYPEAFLKLNYNQRSQLLKTLQRVIANVIAHLVARIEPVRRTNNSDDEPTGELTSMPMMPMDWFATPDSLSTWQQNLEAEISHSLNEISYKVNLLLQQAQILPPNVPKPILEANPEADRQGSNTANIPNVLSVLIERDGDEEQLDRASEEGLLGLLAERRLGLNSVEIVGGASPLENRDDFSEESLSQADDFPEIIQIHSLYLRLTEIEFSDVTVLSLRKNISQLVNKVNSLRREYRQKQQELKIAEAESAWRNSWFEN
jgi:hypothetical protein